jgi:hypothetical protein
MVLSGRVVLLLAVAACGGAPGAAASTPPPGSVEQSARLEYDRRVRLPRC